MSRGVTLTVPALSIRVAAAVAWACGARAPVDVASLLLELAGALSEVPFEHRLSMDWVFSHEGSRYVADALPSGVGLRDAWPRG